MTSRPGSLLAQLGPEPRIAVLRTGRLGDLLVLTPALLGLRAAAPRAHVTLLVNDRAMTLARRLRSVDEIVRVPDLNSMQRLGRGELDQDMCQLIDDMRARHFDLALQAAGGGETTNVFVLALGARYTAGQQWPTAPALDVWMPYQRNQSDVLRLLDLMELIGAARGPLLFDLEITACDEAALAAAPGVPLAELRAGNVVGVSAGAGSGARCWPAERFASVLNAVLAQRPDLHVVLTGTEDERAITSQVLRFIGDKQRVHDMAGALSLDALLAMISHLKLFIGNDSAPAHFATALGVPSVVIFGSAHPAQWAPTGRVWHRAVADETAPCRRFAPPCGCPDNARAICIDAVCTTDVLTQVEQVLGLLQSGNTQGASQVRSGTVVGRS